MKNVRYFQYFFEIMGHETDEHVVYGVRLVSDIGKLRKILEATLCDGEALENEEEMSMMLSQIETFIPNTEYTILNFDDEKDIFVACYYKIHDITCRPDDCLEIKLPISMKSVNYTQNCVKFCTKLFLLY